LQQDIQHILKGCIRKELVSQEKLYRLHYTEMIRVCVRYVQHSEDANALYNAAMLKVFDQLPAYQDQGNFQGWLRKIVINTCIDHCRKKVHFTRTVDDLPEERNSLEPDAYRQISAREVVALIQQLPGNTALVFNLYVMEGYKHEEIAQLLQIPAGTSKWHLSEARRLLKQKFMRHSPTQLQTK
jgi:RNA polymerase sigma-70 factor, ECF subfamily